MLTPATIEIGKQSTKKSKGERDEEVELEGNDRGRPDEGVARTVQPCKSEGCLKRELLLEAELVRR